jgi:hypothetical protein
LTVRTPFPRKKEALILADRRQPETVLPAAHLARTASAGATPAGSRATQAVVKTKEMADALRIYFLVQPVFSRSAENDSQYAENKELLRGGFAAWLLRGVD